jgi:glucose-6-phosphate isomerase
MTTDNSGLNEPMDLARQAAIALAGPGRPAWMDFPGTSPGLLTGFRSLADKRNDLDDVVLIGMGGSSLAAEVISSAASKRLTVLDTTDCHQVGAVLARDPDRMLVVLSSKSGETIETNSLCRVFTRHLAYRLPAEEVARHFVAVTDPGSLLHRIASDRGYDVVLADPSVGGRYSALGPFGLAAASLLGIDVRSLLDESAAMLAELERPDNPGSALGLALASAASAGRDKLVLDVPDPSLGCLGDWIEQLIAESTGKQGRGILPVSGGRATPDSIRATLTGPGLGRSVPGTALLVARPLGAQFLLWEYATVVACRGLGVDPFDQPNVEESKANTAELLRGGGVSVRPDFVDGEIEVYTADGAPRARNVADVLTGLVEQVPVNGYLSVMAYLDRGEDRLVAGLESALRARTPRPVTFGWGPRLLHSVGQYHKGGPPTGVFCQITGAVASDIEIPGRPFTLADLQAAQAIGDWRALRARERPVVRLHLRDREVGIRRLLRAAGGPNARSNW